MSVHDHHGMGYRGRPQATFGGGVSAWGRWVASGVWWMEHSFERARADGRPEEDTRVRIFLILAVFSAVFACLALGAAHAALFAPRGAAGAMRCAAGVGNRAVSGGGGGGGGGGAGGGWFRLRPGQAASAGGRLSADQPRLAARVGKGWFSPGRRRPCLFEN